MFSPSSTISNECFLEVSIDKKLSHILLIVLPSISTRDICWSSLNTTHEVFGIVLRAKYVLDFDAWPFLMTASIFILTGSTIRSDSSPSDEISNLSPLEVSTYVNRTVFSLKYGSNTSSNSISSSFSGLGTVSLSTSCLNITAIPLISLVMLIS